ncbi:MAG: hypothetical protein ACPL7B_03500 [Candidatus Poribacteria bacterium]
MFRSNMIFIIFLVSIIAIALLLSGCYTLIGYPPDARESIEKKYGEKTHRYDYEYYESPYVYYEEYYFYDAFPYYYWYRPWWYRWYYWDDDYYYTPERKPESQKRGTDNIRSSTNDDRRLEKQSDNNKNADSKPKQWSSKDDERGIRRYR